jgi:hypothetical protein
VLLMLKTLASPSVRAQSFGKPGEFNAIIKHLTLFR